MILQTIADSPVELGVSELSKELRIGKSTVHGITSALKELGILYRNPVHKKYSMGYTLFELSKKAYAKIELRDNARKPMEKLREKFGETVFLGVLNEDHVTILDVVESQNELKITSPPGTRLPLLVGATGRVFLAQFEEERVREIVQKMGLRRYTLKSVVDSEQFLKEVKETKERGYAIDDEEYILGVKAIASPIQASSIIPAAIWVVGFKSSLDDQKTEKVIGEILKTAQEITDLLRGH